MLCQALGLHYSIIQQLYEVSILGNLTQGPCFAQGFMSEMWQNQGKNIDGSYLRATARSNSRSSPFQGCSDRLRILGHYQLGKKSTVIARIT